MVLTMSLHLRRTGIGIYGWVVGWWMHEQWYLLNCGGWSVANDPVNGE